jgi:hypothetical protein
VIKSWDVIFNEKDNWDWKNKSVESVSVQIGDDVQQGSNCGSYENDKEEEQQRSLNNKCRAELIFLKLNSGKIEKIKWYLWNL